MSYVYTSNLVENIFMVSEPFVERVDHNILCPD